MTSPGRTGGTEGRDSTIAIDDLVTKKVQVAGVHPNVEQEVILVTEDKVRLCLNENFHRAARSKQWITIASLILTLILTLTTAQFRDFAGLSSLEWRGIAIAALAGAVIWFFASLRWALGAPTLDDIVRELKEGSRKIVAQEPIISVVGDEDVVFVGQRTAHGTGDEITGRTLTSSIYRLFREPTPEIPADIAAVLRDALEAYEQALEWTPNAADDFLNAKDISNAFRRELRLGFAPDSWDYILRRLATKHGETTLHKAGLITPRKEKAGYYDRLRNRLVVPIFRGEFVLGFAGIAFDGNEPVLFCSAASDFFSHAAAVQFLKAYPELRVISGL